MTVVLSTVKEKTLPLVPQASVVENKEGSYVYIVGKDNRAEMRLIKKGSVSGTDWIVEEGIKAGETVVVEGVQKISPGQRVKISSDGGNATSVSGGS